MGMDRNTVIGFVLLGLLLFAYLYNSTKNSQELQKQRQLMEDSIARLNVWHGLFTVASAQGNLQDFLQIVRGTPAGGQ